MARLKKVGLQRGRPGSDQELAIITSQLRWRISAATIRANFTLLLERLSQVGEGARRAERIGEDGGRKDEMGPGDSVAS